jgi:DNA invertase Pin-like site-specific DNA recombinase
LFLHIQAGRNKRVAGWTVTSENVDQGVSGSKESRAELNRLMEDGCQRKFGALLAWEIDRFGGSLEHLVSALAPNPRP